MFSDHQVRIEQRIGIIIRSLFRPRNSNLQVGYIFALFFGGDDIKNLRFGGVRFLFFFQYEEYIEPRIGEKYFFTSVLSSRKTSQFVVCISRLS